jgi:catechol 2,3-dioxygenase-like lactoylglutathione lyase family enzyme
MDATERPGLTGVLETSIYVDDLKRSLDFYERVLGFTCMAQFGYGAAFEAGGAHVLLVWARGQAREDRPTEGGVIPGHDGSGPLHLAFSIPAAAYEPWMARLAAHGIAIRSEVHWSRGGRSLYFDDPDGHVLELATPGVWPNY